jgi:hypothetical protein
LLEIAWVESAIAATLESEVRALSASCAGEQYRRLGCAKPAIRAPGVLFHAFLSREPPLPRAGSGSTAHRADPGAPGRCVGASRRPVGQSAEREHRGAPAASSACLTRCEGRRTFFRCRRRLTLPAVGRSVGARRLSSAPSPPLRAPRRLAAAVRRSGTAQDPNADSYRARRRSSRGVRARAGDRRRAATRARESLPG